jgi:protein N-terminal methyltransferase
LALDCGAGIGRITKYLLLKNFTNVEMVDVTKNFIEEATKYLGKDAKNVSEFYCEGLQRFTPKLNTYDVIWMQWVLLYLTDDDLIEFFKRCKAGLKPNGICVLKENVIREGAQTETAELDQEDASYTRPTNQYIDAIKKAGMEVIKNEKQKNFPKELYEVRLIAFK